MRRRYASWKLNYIILNYFIIISVLWSLTSKYKPAVAKRIVIGSLGGARSEHRTGFQHRHTNPSLDSGVGII
jgi:hypothetical protein